MADKAQATTLTYDGTAVVRITSISGPSMSAPTISVADLDDTIVPKIGSGLADMGQLTLGLNFEADDATHDNLADEVIAGGSAECIIEWQNGTSGTTKWTFDAFPTEFTGTGNVGEALTASVTLDISTEVVITP